MTTRKYYFGVAVILFLVSHSGSSNEWVKHEINLVDEKGNTHIETVSLEIRNGEAYYEGDIFVGYVLQDGTISENPVERFNSGTVTPFAIVATTNKWLSATIPYSVSNLPGPIADAVRVAMDTLESVSGLRFVVRTNQPDYISFGYQSNSDAICSSPIGRRGGMQTISLADYCSDTDDRDQATIIHEIMHSLGFYHEHSRNDRDQWVLVNIENIIPMYRSSFDKVTNNFEYLTPYDKTSIMHYPRTTTNINFVYDVSEPMLTDKINPTAELSGFALSDKDKQALQARFGILASPVLNGLSFYCYGQGTLSWSNVSGASQYKLSYGVSSSPYINIMTITSGTSYTVMSANESRVYTVKTCNANGACSLDSNSVYMHYYPECL